MGQVITISQQKGGAGKTTIAAHIIVGLAQKGYNVVGLDIDPQESLTTWYEARKEFGNDSLASFDFRSTSDWWRLRLEIDRLREQYDFVVIDCPPHTKNDAKTAVKEADLVIIPMQPSPTDLWASTSTLELTLKENANTYLVLNRIIQNSNIAKEFLRDLPSNRIVSTLGNRIAFATSLSEGKTVLETKHAKASAEIKTLLDRVLAIMATQSEPESEEELSLAG